MAEQVRVPLETFLGSPWTLPTWVPQLSQETQGKSGFEDLKNTPQHPQHMGRSEVASGIQPRPVLMSSELQLKGWERREGRGKANADWLVQIPTERAAPLPSGQTAEAPSHHCDVCSLRLLSAPPIETPGNPPACSQTRILYPSSAL